MASFKSIPLAVFYLFMVITNAIAFIDYALQYCFDDSVYGLFEDDPDIQSVLISFSLTIIFIVLLERELYRK